MKTVSSRDQSNLANAALIACLVQTLDGGLDLFQARFEENLHGAQERLKDAPLDLLQAVEVLVWVEELLGECKSPIAQTGQGQASTRAT